ncbi:MAG: DegV family protein [Clostridia bacterium]|nr:DegV family protein [Clostridia bacterium]
MRSIRIVTDSSSDITTLTNIEFAYAPMKILTAEREFVDNDEINVAEMAEYLAQYKGKSKSSCPNTEDWMCAFGDAEEIFCVTITSGLSGSYNAACTAARLYEEAHPGRRVFVLDSLSAGPEISLAVYKLESLISEGLSFDEICVQISAYLKHTGLTFMLKSLNNFANNGRVSPLVAKLVGIAGICIVGRASEEGTLEPLHKCRGEARALTALITELKERGLQSGRVSIGHCFNEAGAQTLRGMIEKEFPGVQTEIHPFKGLCAFYAELGGILVGFEKM